MWSKKFALIELRAIDNITSKRQISSISVAKLKDLKRAKGVMISGDNGRKRCSVLVVSASFFHVLIFVAYEL